MVTPLSLFLAMCKAHLGSRRFCAVARATHDTGHDDDGHVPDTAPPPDAQAKTLCERIEPGFLHGTLLSTG